jgi:anion-transporting  ArsA/GET3 family ATPase
VSALEDVIKEKEIIVCVGPGGVGKTTISATLALEGAFAGKKTLALTVDPALRLATSLGISGGKGRNIQIRKDRFKRAGFIPKGALHVMMLDVKSTFDELIERVAPSESQRDKILTNKYYRSIADSLAGSQEYMAMEALLSAYEEGDYDLIVVDTPPSRHVLNFLSAPRTLLNNLDNTASKLILKSYSLMNRWSFGFTKVWTSVALKALEKVVGVDVLHDVWEFFMNFESVSEPITERAEKAFRLLRSSESMFLIVSGPRKSTLTDSLKLYSSLINEGFEVGGVIANRVHSTNGLPNLENETKALLDEDSALAKKLVRNYENYKNIANSEKKNLEEFERSLRGEIPVVCVPYFDVEVYDLEKLIEFRSYLLEKETL